MKVSKVIIAFIVILALIAIGIIVVGKEVVGKADQAVQCANDVKECSPGQYVRRVSPSCEFPDCPVAKATSTPKFAVSCEVGHCPFDIYEGDSGKSFTYSVTSRYTIFLNEETHPKVELKTACEPKGAIGEISNIPAVTPPLYAVRYEAVKLGICTITDRDFAIQVNITD